MSASTAWMAAAQADGRHGSGPVDSEAWRGIPPCQSRAEQRGGPRHRSDHDLSPGHRRGTRSVTNKRRFRPDGAEAPFVFMLSGTKKIRHCRRFLPRRWGPLHGPQVRAGIALPPAASGLSAASSALVQFAPPSLRLPGRLPAHCPRLPGAGLALRRRAIASGMSPSASTRA